MSDLQGWNADNVAPSTGEFEPVPNGTYMVAITDSEKKQNENGYGFLFTYQVLSDGDAKGKTFRIYTNYQHTNAQAQEIGQKDLSAISHVTGKKTAQNVAEFHNIPFMAKVAVTPPSVNKATGKEYGAGNKITQYLYANGEKIGGGVVGAIGATAAAPKAASGKPAWAKTG